MKKKMSVVIIALGCLLVGISLILLLGNKTNSNNNNNSNNKKKDNNSLEHDGWVFKLPKDWKDEGTDSNGRNVSFNNTVDDVIGYNGAFFNITSTKNMKYSMDELFSESSVFIKGIENSKAIELVEEHKIIQHNDKPVMIFPFKFVDDETSLAYRVLTPADDEYFYDFQLFSNRVVDGQDEMFFNYDAVLLFVDFLQTGKKSK